jgi:hypothetical protein
MIHHFLNTPFVSFGALKNLPLEARASFALKVILNCNF